jgi:CrcB protein
VLALVIFLGAGIGGLARYGVGVWTQSVIGPAFPWGTLLVNVTGSLLLTFLYVTLEGTAGTPEWRAFLGIGFCGGYTTFSTFSYETMRLLQDGEWQRATMYIAGSVVLSLAGAVLGFRLGSMILQRS